MKQALYALALAAVTFACASEPKAAVGDNAAPMSECSTEKSGECSTEMKAECSTEKKAECSTEKKAECATEAKTCPVTGQSIN